MKIVAFDLEIIPNLQQALKHWTTLSSKYDTKTMKATVSTICSAGYMELGDKKASCINAWDFPEWKKDVNNDKKVCKKIYDVLHDADVVLSWSGKRFDYKYLQTRLLYHDLPMLPKINHVDFCQLVKSNFLLINNRLGTFGDEILNNSKLEHTGWKLWVDTHNRDKEACKLMDKYCRQDVALLLDCFKKLRPLIKELPNQNLNRSLEDILEGNDVCPTCGGKNLLSNGWRHTKTKSYRRMQCKDCKTWSRVDANGKNPRVF